MFNLDAEDELSRGGPHTPTDAIRARALSLLPLLRRLLRPGDEVLWPAAEPTSPPRAKWGRAWCPTQWACAQLQRAGLTVPPAPSAQVLREANHRRFSQGLGQALPGARFVQTVEELLDVLGDAALLKRVSTQNNWLLKRPLAYAGRGRRKIAPGRELGAVDRQWIEAALRSGDGLQIEPFVVRELDCSLHAWLAADGALVLGEPAVSNIDSSGAWVSTTRAAPGALTAAERAALTEQTKATAKALGALGYFGPFGLDAFRWRAPDGELHFQPRCEVNARYSMGWAVGMGEFRPPAGA